MGVDKTRRVISVHEAEDIFKQLKERLTPLGVRVIRLCTPLTSVHEGLLLAKVRKTPDGVHPIDFFEQEVKNNIAKVEEQGSKVLKYVFGFWWAMGPGSLDKNTWLVRYGEIINYPRPKNASNDPIA